MLATTRVADDDLSAPTNGQPYGLGDDGDSEPGCGEDVAERALHRGIMFHDGDADAPRHGAIISRRRRWVFPRQEDFDRALERTDRNAPGPILRRVDESLLAWHDFNVSVVTASAALLGLLFVVLALHVRGLSPGGGNELRSVARTVFLAYVVALGFGFLGLMPQDLRSLGLELVVLVLAVTPPFARAAREGLRASGVGYARRVTVAQFVAGVALVAITITAAMAVAGGDARALFVIAGVAVVSLLWGLANTWELIFRARLEH